MALAWPNPSHDAGNTSPSLAALCMHASQSHRHRQNPLQLCHSQTSSWSSHSRFTTATPLIINLAMACPKTYIFFLVAAVGFIAPSLVDTDLQGHRPPTKSRMIGSLSSERPVTYCYEQFSQTPQRPQQRDACTLTRDSYSSHTQSSQQ